MKKIFFQKKRIFFKFYYLILFTFICFNGISQEINYKSQCLYLYVFSKNIYWPNDHLKENFVIGVYGNSPIFEELEIMASIKKAANGKKIIIKQFFSSDKIEDVDILYISSSKSRDLKKILNIIENKPILIVAERDGLAKKGASINFIIMEDDTLKFEVNRSVMEKLNLEISDGLLKHGFEVG